MGRKFSFLYVDIYSNVPKGKYILKNKFRILVVFPTVFVADTKIIYGYNFAAPLQNTYKFKGSI